MKEVPQPKHQIVKLQSCIDDSQMRGSDLFGVGSNQEPTRGVHVKSRKGRLLDARWFLTVAVLVKIIRARSAIPTESIVNSYQCWRGSQSRRQTCSRLEGFREDFWVDGPCCHEYHTIRMDFEWWSNDMQMCTKRCKVTSELP